METKVLNYRIIVTPEKHQGKIVYNALSPTLGVADWGNSMEKALEHIKGAIECHIESLIKNNEPIPMTDTTDFMIANASIPFPKDFSPSFI